MVAMFYGFVSAIWAMLMGVPLESGMFFGAMFIHMIAVDGMLMAIMKIIYMIAMLHSLVSAIGTVLVFVCRVRSVCSCCQAQASK